MGAALCAAFRLRCPRGSEAGKGKRPNHRIQGLKADVLLFASEGGRGFGSVFRHQIQKPELVSGFFTSAVCARTGGASRLCLASVTPHISPFLALFGLSVLQFYLLASRACARSLPVLARVLGQRVVAGNSCSGGDRAQGCPPKCKRARDLSPFCARFVIGKNGA